MLFGLFKRKQKPQFSPENQLLLTELEKFRIRYRGQGPHDDMAVDVVVREVSRGLRTDGKYANDLIVKGGWSVPDATHMIISEYTSSEIMTGQFHLYRGVLNDKGKAYLKLFKVSSAKLMASGRLSEKEAVEGVREFEDEIAKLG
ncbi:hypothetical protein J2767_003600 [Agrobacterium tumefaciens]|uniref:hypothetical protein n=1 Tax=Agrobacterium tumefaciens TaxID=358 RepID=UPI001AE9CC5D|nr:hypothetical protein [Agrobacterium tumefaciens]MBP2572422.1 hypothetical protein [Agrobacterium tumefaciens]